jgi:hypothetical protein
VALLQASGEYWRRYGTHYTDIVAFYNGSDAVVKAQIKKLIPDIERMVASQDARNHTSITQSTPTGAYITLSARYLPTWKLMQAGKTSEAIRSIIGVMNADPKYHLQELPTLARILAMRGDSPAEIERTLQESRTIEKTGTQDIGLHFLAVLYEKAAAESSGTKSKEFYRLAYETWYRSRQRDALDFYARTNSFRLQDRFGFKPPQQIIDAIKKSPENATPKTVPALVS